MLLFIGENLGDEHKSFIQGHTQGDRWDSIVYRNVKYYGLWKTPRGTGGNSIVYRNVRYYGKHPWGEVGIV